MANTGAKNSDIKLLKGEIKDLRGEISKLGKVIEKGNSEDKHRYLISVALAFMAMAIGVIYVPIDAFRGVTSPAVMAFSLFVYAGLKYLEAFKSYSEPKGIHKNIETTGFMSLAVGTIMYILPPFRNSLLQVYGLLVALAGFLIMGINTISLKKKAN